MALSTQLLRVESKLVRWEAMLSDRAKATARSTPARARIARRATTESLGLNPEWALEVRSRNF